ELVAMAEAQPKVWNFTSSMMPSSLIFRYIRMMSPHLALPTSPTPLASSMTPTLWGWAKCSMTFSLYSIAIVVSSFLCSSPKKAVPFPAREFRCALRLVAAVGGHRDARFAQGVFLRYTPPEKRSYYFARRARRATLRGL